MKGKIYLLMYNKMNRIKHVVKLGENAGINDKEYTPSLCCLLSSLSNSVWVS